MSTIGDRVQSILEARARKLARPLVDTAAAQDTQFLTFTIAGESYAIEIGYVFEVNTRAHVSALPGVQPPLSGLTLWRGELLPVLDIASMQSTSTANNALVVVGSERAAFALRVAAVHAIRTIDRAQLHTAGSRADREYVSGLTKDAVVVIDAERLLQLYS